jgi:hypothetical protein
MLSGEADDGVIDGLPTTSLILVDEFGSAFLVIAPPSSNQSSRKSNSNLPIVLFEEKKSLSRNVTDGFNIRGPDAGMEIKDSSNEKAQELIESAVTERRNYLEKDAERKAQIIFKKWCKDKKTLEQAIDESLRY